MIVHKIEIAFAVPDDVDDDRLGEIAYDIEDATQDSMTAVERQLDAILTGIESRHGVDIQLTIHE